MDPFDAQQLRQVLTIQAALAGGELVGNPLRRLGRPKQQGDGEGRK
jgi:hypothetical protein